jgi:hypothetical protein
VTRGAYPFQEEIRREHLIKIRGRIGLEIAKIFLDVESSSDLNNLTIRTKHSFKKIQARHSHGSKIKLSISANDLITIEVLLLEIARSIGGLTRLLDESNTSTSLDPFQKGNG